MRHAVRLLRGYRKSGKPVYECVCGEIIVAWTSKEAHKKHQEDLKK